MVPVFSDSMTKLMGILTTKRQQNMFEVGRDNLEHSRTRLHKPRGLAKRALIGWLSCRMCNAKALPPISTVGLIPPRGTSLIYPPLHEHCCEPTMEIKRPLSCKHADQSLSDPRRRPAHPHD